MVGLDVIEICYVGTRFLDSSGVNLSDMLILFVSPREWSSRATVIFTAIASANRAPEHLARAMHCDLMTAQIRLPLARYLTVWMAANVLSFYIGQQLDTRRTYPLHISEARLAHWPTF